MFCYNLGTKQASGITLAEFGESRVVEVVLISAEPCCSPGWTGEEIPGWNCTLSIWVGESKVGWGRGEEVLWRRSKRSSMKRICILTRHALCNQLGLHIATQMRSHKHRLPTWHKEGITINHLILPLLLKLPPPET